MPIGVTINKLQHRYGSFNPTVNVTGWPGAAVLVGDQYYAGIDGSGNYVWPVKNRTMEGAIVQAIGMNGITWNMTADVTYDTPNGGLVKSGADGFGSGAYSASATSDIGVQGRVVSTSVTTTLFLQSGTVTYNFFDNTCEHAMVFGAGGGSIWEYGINKAIFTFAVGDYGLIMRKGSVVKYYLVNGTTKEVTLIRSTRSLLASSAFAVCGLYHNTSRMNEMGVWYGDSATTTIDIYGVLSSELQDLRNQSALESLAESTTNKDKSQDFTYPSIDKNLMTLTLDLEWRFEQQYQEFKEFFQWHDLDLPFIFVDMARNKLKLVRRDSLLDNELMVRFVSRWTDDPLGAGLYGVSVDIMQMVNPPRLSYGT